MGIFGTFVISLIIGFLYYGFSPTFTDLEPQAFRVRIFDRLSGALKANNRLNAGERLFEGEVLGPESLAQYEGSIYTGTANGCITKITGNESTCFIKLTGHHGKTNCRRPLGMRFDKEGTLYFVDGCRGLFSANVKTGSVNPLLTTEEEINGKPLTLPDDLSISSDGVIRISDASVRWNLLQAGLSFVEHENSGRIIQFDTKTNKTSVLVDGLYFPNGVQLSKSEDSLLIAESTNHRILRHYLRGDKKGQTEVFADVPGIPDNIRTGENGYWIALLNYNNPLTAGLMDRLNEYPFFRKLIIRFQQSIAFFLRFINQSWKSELLEDFADELQSGFTWIVPPVLYGMAVEIDEDGKFIQSLQSPDGKSGTLSEILEDDSYIYAGSFFNRYLIRVKKTKQDK